MHLQVCFSHDAKPVTNYLIFSSVLSGTLNIAYSLGNGDTSSKVFVTASCSALILGHIAWSKMVDLQAASKVGPHEPLLDPEEPVAASADVQHVRTRLQAMDLSKCRQWLLENARRVSGVLAHSEVPGTSDSEIMPHSVNSESHRSLGRNNQPVPGTDDDKHDATVFSESTATAPAPETVHGGAIQMHDKLLENARGVLGEVPGASDSGIMQEEVQTQETPSESAGGPTG